MQRLRLKTRINDQTTTVSEVSAEMFNQRQKVLASLRRLALLWGAALISVLVPVAHFVLVPAFLIVGVVFSFRTLKSPGRLFESDILCPKCQTNIHLKSKEIHWPLIESCSACGIQTRSEPA